jgi:hypothetical protein
MCKRWCYLDFAFVHSSNSDKQWSQWTVTPTGEVQLQAYTGKLVTRCSHCGISAVQSSTEFVAIKEETLG